MRPEDAEDHAISEKKRQVESRLREELRDLKEGDDDDRLVELASTLVALSWTLRMDDSGAYRFRSFTESEALLAEAHSALASSDEPPDGWAWLSWHTAVRRLHLAAGDRRQAARADALLLERLEAAPHADYAVLSRLRGWLIADSAEG